MSFIRFLVTARGRVLRAITGILLISIGWFLLWNHGGILLTVAGLLLLISAINDVCLLAALFDHSVEGEALRTQAQDEHRTLRHSH